MDEASTGTSATGPLQHRAAMLDRLLHGESHVPISTTAEAAPAPGALKPKRKFDEQLSACRSRCDALSDEVAKLLSEVRSSKDPALRERYFEITGLKRAADDELQELTERLIAKRQPVRR